MDFKRKIFSAMLVVLVLPTSLSLISYDINDDSNELSDCPQNIIIEPGPTWRTITVGVSSLFDIEEVMGIRFAHVVSLEPEMIYRNNLYVHLTDARAYAEGLPTYVEVCMIGTKIGSISLVPDADNATPSAFLHEWVQLYGTPEIVTWGTSGNSWRWRTVAWPSNGIILTVDISATVNDPTIALVNLTMLAPFYAGDANFTQWPYSALEVDQPTSANEGYPAEENPFDFEGML